MSLENENQNVENIKEENSTINEDSSSNEAQFPHAKKAINGMNKSTEGAADLARGVKKTNYPSETSLNDENKKGNNDINNSKQQNNQPIKNDNKADNQSAMPGQINKKPDEKEQSQTNQNKNANNNQNNKANDDKNNDQKRNLSNKLPVNPSSIASKVPGLGAALSLRNKARNIFKPKEEKEEEKQQEEEPKTSSEMASIASKIPGIISFVLKYKFFIGISLLLIVIVAGIFFILALTGGVALMSYCNQTSYDVNGADTTAFLCSMSDPFGTDLNNVEYNVVSLVGKRNPPLLPDGSYATGFHYGTDITGIVGKNVSTIHAVADGVVEQAGYNGGYGYSVLINHQDKFYTRYAHMKDSLKVKEGDDVKSGDELGIMGSTGDSQGDHLHFELLDSNKKTLSANPFFGYSDLGYEACLNENSSIDTKTCDMDVSGEARFIGREEFKQMCGKKNYYTNNRCCSSNNNSSSSDGLVEFIKTFEGSGGYCDAAKTQYKAYQNPGDRVTIGYGVTSDFLPDLTHAGQCMSVSKVDAAKLNAINSKRETVIKPIFKDVTLSQHQEDALTSMAYNGCGGYFEGIATAVKTNNYQAIWDAMKGCVNAGSDAELGLKRRRKAEFALFVSGDYTIASEYKSKTWTTEEYNKYDSDGLTAKQVSTSSAYCSNTNSSNNIVVAKALEELDAWNEISNKPAGYCSAISKYLQSCGYGAGQDHYCAGFVTYVLKETGMSEKIGLPNYTCVVSNFYGTKTGEVHQAGGSYVPNPGDLIIFDWDGTRTGADHIGIVEKVEGNRVYTIEGNSGSSSAAYCGFGAVKQRDYDIANVNISKYISY